MCIYIVVGDQNHWFLSEKHLLYKGGFDLDLLLIPLILQQAYSVNYLEQKTTWT